MVISRKAVGFPCSGRVDRCSSSSVDYKSIVDGGGIDDGSFVDRENIDSCEGF